LWVCVLHALFRGDKQITLACVLYFGRYMNNSSMRALVLLHITGPSPTGIHSILTYACYLCVIKVQNTNVPPLKNCLSVNSF
jgi:hypothetical protein